MLLPLEWLKQFVEVNETAEAVAARFTLLGFETELHSASIIDLDVTPNRGDVLSILGLAREYAAATNQELKFPPVQALPAGDLPNLTIQADPKAYHALSAIVVEDLVVADSPAWMQQRLREAGQNSINNLVDLTNYVMVELGIPMHAFDLDKIADPTLKIRLSQKDEKFISLKDESVTLPENSIVVENNGEIIDLLGIRGGKSSMITADTKRALIWAASVPRPLIRRTSKLLNLRTDGSYRHERETDWDMVPLAIQRIAELLKETTGGRVSDQLTLQAEQREPKVISYSVEKMEQLLGMPIGVAAAESALTRLGFTLNNGTATVPSWRHFDISFSEDLTEEVARIVGYNTIPRQCITSTPKASRSEYAQIESIKDTLAQAGWTEVYTESFTGKLDSKGLSLDSDNLAVLANPVNRDFANCRPSMVPNLVKILALNSWSDDAQIFEIGRIFPSTNEEVNYIGLAATGKRAKVLQQFVDPSAIQVITSEHPVAQQYKLRKPVTIAEIPVTDWEHETSGSYIVPTKRPDYKTVSPLPPAVRDISIIVDKAVDPDTIIATALKIDPLIMMVELFDQFESDSFGTNKQSLAFHIIYQSVKTTLDTATVDTIHEKIIATLVDSYQATIR